MSDRFYMQQCEHFKISPTERMLMDRFPEDKESIKLRKKLSGDTTRKATTSKKDLVAEIEELVQTKLPGLAKATIPVLESLIGSIKVFDLEQVPEGFVTPTGRNKKPFNVALQTVLRSDVDLSGCTIDTIKSLVSQLTRK